MRDLNTLYRRALKQDDLKTAVKILALKARLIKDRREPERTTFDPHSCSEAELSRLLAVCEDAAASCAEPSSAV